MVDRAQFVSQPVPGRSCGTCTLCCKVYDDPVLEKAAGAWCKHCNPGKGCGIYETRPDPCRAFHCLWMTTDFLGPEWKPDQSAFVLSVDPASRNLLVQVDPGRPGAWRSEPYLRQFRMWAEAGLSTGRHVIVYVNRTATAVLPDREVPLGVIKDGDRVIFSRTMTPGGPQIDVRKQSA